MGKVRRGILAISTVINDMIYYIHTENPNEHRRVNNASSKKALYYGGYRLHLDSRGARKWQKME